VGIFNPNVLFWLGVLHMAYVTTSPVPVFFLTVDRICALKPTDAIGQHRNGKIF
jgi:hypothetical protein